MSDLGDIRQEYVKGQLLESSAAADAIEQFQSWFEAYQASEPLEPTVMTLASVDARGMPWQRIVLLKNYDAQGFVFFTNYDSNKGQQLGLNPNACLHFSWLTQERQVIVQGNVEQITRAESQAYFHSRPRESQLGAWASQQSRPVAHRVELEANYQRVEQEYDGQEIPLPDFWGGYRLMPERIEFWQGGAHRLHDRLEYVKAESGWQRQRLNP